MVLTGYKYNGVPIRAPGGGLAGNTACCCNQGTTTCCCLDNYCTDPMGICDNLTAILSGAVVGTITLEPSESSEGYCRTWKAMAAVADSACDSDLITVDITVRCPTGSTSPDDLEIIVTNGGAECNIIKAAGAAGDPVNPDPGGACFPLDATATDGWEIQEILPGFCDCEGSLLTVRITGP